MSGSIRQVRSNEVMEESGASSNALTLPGGASVAFNSDATSLAGDDTNGHSDVFVKNLSTVNRPPTALALSYSTVAENVTVGTVVGTLTAADPDAGDTAVFSLVAGDDAAGNAAFTVNGNQLRLAISPDFEARRGYLIRVRATDSGGLYREQLFIVDVADVNESPTRLSIAGLDAVKAEGDNGSTTFTFVVTRSGPTSAASSVKWSTDVDPGSFPSFRVALYFPARGPGFASASDFAGGARPTGTINFAPGETSKVITVDVAGDTTVEPLDQFGIRLHDAVGAEIDDELSIAGQILDDDFKPRTTVTNFATATEVTYSLTGASRATIASVVSDKLEFISVDGVRYGRTLQATGLDVRRLRDYDGNDLGGSNGWRLKGIAPVQTFENDQSYILVNPGLQRWAQVAVHTDGGVNIDSHGPRGDARVVGAYNDPLIALGLVAEGSPVDSQTRFANDLARDNLSVLGGADYDRNEFVDLFFKLNDHAADHHDDVFLRAILYADGNMQYANYMDATQTIDWMQAAGVSSAVYASWLNDGANLVPNRFPVSDDELSRLFLI